jgi:predicted nucleic acid-binding protein
MRSSVFLDTSGWIALLNATDVLHEKALNHWIELMRHGNGVIVTDWIIAETGNGLSRSSKKFQFESVVRQMMDAPSVELMVIDRELIKRALSMYVQYSDKSWGLVDCASFIVMQERGVTEAFTSDRHFEQAGFRCLLPS